MKTTILVLLAAATSCSGAVHADSHSGKAAWKGKLDKGDTVYVRNINGRVRVVAAKGSSVVVRADARGGAKVEVVAHAGGVTICGVPKAKSYSCEKNGQLDVNGEYPEDSLHAEVLDRLVALARHAAGQPLEDGPPGPDES